jgi:hypothetical protein
LAAEFDVESMRERSLRFWSREEIDRPLVSVWVGTQIPFDSYPSGVQAIAPGRLTPEMIDVERFLPDYDRLFSMHERAGGDIPWVAIPFWGMCWMEAILGCEVRSSEGTIWAEPFLDDWTRLDEVHLSPDNPWFKKLLEFTESLASASRSRYPVGVTLMRGLADLLSAARGHSQAIYDLYDYPEQVETFIERCTEIWVEVAKAQLERIPAFCDGYALGLYQLWAPGSAGWSQEDTVSSWSPELYHRFLEGAESRIANAFEYSGFHLHSPCMYPLDHLLSDRGASVVEVNYDASGPALSELMPTFRRIQEHKPLLIWGDFTPEELEDLKRWLSPRGLALQVIVDSEEEADRMLRQLGTGWRQGSG